MKVAIVGSGISGLAVAHRLRHQAHITLFEANDDFGGHTHTVDVTLPDGQGRLVTHGVDTGFLVFNERTYPNLIALLAELGVPTAPSDMSFSVQVPAGAHGPALEWGGASLATVFAQRRNWVRPRFWGMLADLLRFNRLCTRLAEHGRDADLQQPLGEFLQAHGFGAAFRDWYFLPMIGCIWSCPTDQMLRFPVATMIRFCHNHGLLQVNDRPQWYTVAGGARQYVERIVARIPDARRATPVRRIERDVAGATVFTDAGAERFDEVVIATHSDQALALLAHPSAEERAVLGAIRYQPNRAVLHTDTAALPRRRAVWSAWNYERAPDAQRESSQVCLHYWLNVLQPLPFAQPVVESLNPVRPIAAEHILAAFEYHHPVFDGPAIAAQRAVPRLQGHWHTWYCGAWTGYGFHEDGLKAGLAVADALQARLLAQRAAA
ncbi:MAG: NAD(P)/FAD-dependent oxidoreductase [Tepidimonas sp.]